MDNKKVLVGSLAFLLILGVIMGTYYNLPKETYLVPSSYEPPHITNQQGEVYREEQSELFKQINYSGVKEYTIPLN